MGSSSSRRAAGHTLVELLVAAGVFTVVMAVVMSSWFAVQRQYVDGAGYSQCIADRTRLTDYLSRDIRRALDAKAYNGATPCADGVAGKKLELTMPRIYGDLEEEDNFSASRLLQNPVIVSGKAGYGATLIVSYAVNNGVVIREEAGIQRPVTATPAQFALSFMTKTGGIVGADGQFQQPFSHLGGHTLTRPVKIEAVRRNHAF